MPRQDGDSNIIVSEFSFLSFSVISHCPMLYHR